MQINKHNDSQYNEHKNRIFENFEIELFFKLKFIIFVSRKI